MVGRLISALLRGEPDLPVTPMRRTPTGLIIGLILAALAVGGLVVFALLVPGGATAWRKPGTLIVEKQTGNRYVLLDGRLRPVLNYASARLLLGPKLVIDSVSAKSLAGVPRGGAVGIVGAPDVLPGSAASDAPWLVCATSTVDTSGTGHPALALRVGTGTGTGAQPLPDRLAVLVRTAEGTRYLAWRDRRMRLSAPWVAQALGLDDSAALPVRDSWIDALPAGPDLGPRPVPGQGLAGPQFDGQPSKVGQVFVVHGTGVLQRFYQLSAGGLVPMTATGVALALGDPAIAQSYGGQPPQPRELSPAALGAATVLPAPDWQAQAPPSPPTLAAGAQPAGYRAVPGHRGGRQVPGGGSGIGGGPRGGRHLGGAGAGRPAGAAADRTGARAARRRRWCHRTLADPVHTQLPPNDVRRKQWRFPTGWTTGSSCRSSTPPAT